MNLIDTVAILLILEADLRLSLSSDHVVVRLIRILTMRLRLPAVLVLLCIKARGSGNERHILELETGGP